jgi:hypothetical protein
MPKQRNQNIKSTCNGETVSMNINALINHYFKKANETNDVTEQHIYKQHAEHYIRVKANIKMGIQC